MLQKGSPGRIMKVKNGYEISIYSGIADPTVILQSVNRLKAAFPKMGDEFFNILSERIVKNGFSNERLQDAVNYVIDNFHYKELNVSDIIKFDKKVKLYTYNEVTCLVTEGKASMDDFKIVEIDGKTYRVRNK